MQHDPGGIHDRARVPRRQPRGVVGSALEESIRSRFSRVRRFCPRGSRDGLSRQGGPKLGQSSLGAFFHRPFRQLGVFPGDFPTQLIYRGETSSRVRVDGRTRIHNCSIHTLLLAARPGREPGIKRRGHFSRGGPQTSGTPGREEYQSGGALRPAEPRNLTPTGVSLERWTAAGCCLKGLERAAFRPDRKSKSCASEHFLFNFRCIGACLRPFEKPTRAFDPHSSRHRFMQAARHFDLPGILSSPTQPRNADV